MRTILSLGLVGAIAAGVFAFTLLPKKAISEARSAPRINTYALTLTANPSMAESTDAH